MTDQVVGQTKKHTELWVQRTGQRRYSGHSTRGAEVLIGPESAEGVFTPGELMKIALGACSAMSADIPLQRSLGETFDATIRIEGKADRETETYPELHEVFELDLSELDEATQKRVLTVAQRAIDKVCTVGNTLKAGTKVTLEFKLD